MTRRSAKDGWGKRLGKPWSEEDVARLIRLRVTSDNWEWIAAQFPGRTVMSCQSKYHYHFAPRRTHPKADEVHVVNRATMMWPTDKLKTETLKRPFRTDLTGVLCGDPAPGRSALEGCNRAERRPISLAPLACLSREEAAP